MLHLRNKITLPCGGALAKVAALIALFCAFAGLLFSQANMQLLHSIASPIISGWMVDVKGGGDLNGDGYDDIVVAGVPRGNSDFSSEIHIYLGGNQISINPDYIIDDLEIHDNQNSAIAYNADINGDGYCDLVVGDPYYGLENWGRVLIYFGGPGFNTTPDVILDGLDFGIGSNGMMFGENIDISGDFNGDGINDLVVTMADANLAHYGQACIFFGGPEIGAQADWSYCGEIGEKFAAEIAVGDVNGDGFSDLVTVSYGVDGLPVELTQSVKIFLGGTEFDNQADASYAFDQNYLWPRIFVDGDVNGDGLDDLIFSKHEKRILFGSQDLTNQFENFTLPVQGAAPWYYVVANDTTFIVNSSGTTNPPHKVFYLSSYNSEGQLVNNYQYAYAPEALSGCEFGYYLGDVNNDGNFDILVTDRQDNSLIFRIITTRINSQSNNDLVTIPTGKITASPNPFTDTTKLCYDLKTQGRTTLSVYNIKGQLVAKIRDTYRGKGQYSDVWDGKDNRGRKLPSGIYLIRLSVDGRPVSHKKITLCN